MPDTQHPPIPVTLLTGFLGSGKTTLLNRLVRQPAMSRTLVVINEFGDIALDHELFSATNESELVTLDSGCVCCSVRGDLVKTLRDLPWRFARGGQPFFDRVVIETTGLADPAPIIHTLIREPRIARAYRLDGIVTTVDTVHGQASLDVHDEARQQAALADRLLLAKCDLASAETRAALDARLAGLNPGAARIAVHEGDIAAETLLDLGINQDVPDAGRITQWLGDAAPSSDSPSLRGLRPTAGFAPPSPLAPAGQTTRAAHHHDERIQTYAYTFTTPIEPVRLHTWLDLVLGLMGERMLRIKGLLNLAGEDYPTVLHGVQHILHPLTRLPAWPSDDRHSRLVFITRDTPRHTLDNLITALD